MQGCQFVESHKSVGCGPVRIPETVPAREQTRKQTKNNKQKQKTHNQSKIINSRSGQAVGRKSQLVTTKNNFWMNVESSFPLVLFLVLVVTLGST